MKSIRECQKSLRFCTYLALIFSCIPTNPTRPWQRPYATHLLDLLNIFSRNLGIRLILTKVVYLAPHRQAVKIQFWIPQQGSGTDQTYGSRYSNSCETNFPSYSTLLNSHQTQNRNSNLGSESLAVQLANLQSPFPVALPPKVPTIFPDYFIALKARDDNETVGLILKTTTNSTV